MPRCIPATEAHCRSIYSPVQNLSKKQKASVCMLVSVKRFWRVQGSVAREVPESPRQAKAKAKENKKGRDGGMPAAAARTPHTSEYAQQLKKVTCLHTSLVSKYSCKTTTVHF